MERSSDPHHSTADLLSWPQIHHSSAANPSNQVRSPPRYLILRRLIQFQFQNFYFPLQPSDDIGDVLGRGGRTTNKEAESLNKK